MLEFSPRSLCLGGGHRTIQRNADQAFHGPKSGRQYDIVGVLQGGHAACILVERVEKATDNSNLRCFATAADASFHPISCGNGDQS